MSSPDALAHITPDARVAMIMKSRMAENRMTHDRTAG